MLWRSLTAICAAILLLSYVELGYCSGNEDGEKENEKPSVTLSAMYENPDGTVKINLYFMQSLLQGKESKDVNIRIKMEGSEVDLAAAAAAMKVYFTKSVTVDQCGNWTMKEGDVELSKMIQEKISAMAPEGSEGTMPGDSSGGTVPEGGSAGSSEEGGGARRRRNAAAAPTNGQILEIMIPDGGNLFEKIGATLVFINGDVRVCKEIKMGETKGLKMLKIKYAATSGFDRDQITKMIVLKTNMSEGSVQLRDLGVMDGCYVVDVYFNSDFKDNKLLKNVYSMLATDSNMGYYSSNDKCKTDYMSGFVGKYIAKRFAEGDGCMKEGKDYAPEQKSQCPSSCMVQQIAENYKKTLEDYNKRVKAYYKKWGNDDGYDGEGRGCDGAREGEGAREQPYYRRQQSEPCNCDDYQDSEDPDTMYFKYLAKYVGMGPRDELKEKAAELKELLKGQMAGQVDTYKIKMLGERIAELQMEAKERALMTGAALCLMSKGGDKSFEYLKMAKERIEKAENADEEGKKILKEKLMYVIEAVFKKLSSGDYKKKNVTKADFKKQVTYKLQKIFNANTECSSEEDRIRVTMAIWGMNASAPMYLKPIIEKLDIEKITKFFEDSNMFGEGFDDFATTIFSLIYVPFSVKENADMLMKVEKFMELIAENAEQLMKKGKDLMEEASVEELMTIGLMLMSGDDIKEGCSLKKLAEQAMKQGQEPCDGNRDQGSYYGEDDYATPDREYGYGRGGRMGYGFRQYGGRKPWNQNQRGWQSGPDYGNDYQNNYGSGPMQRGPYGNQNYGQGGQYGNQNYGQGGQYRNQNYGQDVPYGY
ncbi:uncharacterized protein LOC120328900 [Styela clava]